MRKKTHAAIIVPSQMSAPIENTVGVPTLHARGQTVGELSVPRFRTDTLPLIAQMKQYLGAREVADFPGLPPVERFPISGVEAADVPLPYGVPRHVRAGLLKLLAGGREIDALLERRGDTWEFVDEDALIDLRDRSRVFRVGRSLIFS